MDDSHPASRAAYMHVEIRGFDPDAFAEVIRGGAFDHKSLGHGLLNADIESWAAAGVSVDRGHYGFATLVEGEFHPDQLCFGLVDSPGVGAWINGNHVRRNHVQSYAEGADMLYRAEADTRWAALQVSRERLQARAIETTGRTLALPSKGMVDRALSPESVDRLRRRIDRALRDARSDAASAADQHAEGILDTLVAALRPLESDADAKIAARQTETIRRALRWMRDHSATGYDSEPLCRSLEIPERTLQLYFRTCLGHAPSRVHRQLRLHQVRQALLSDRTRDPARVTAAATRFGFEHLGRFAGDYRKLFGERPSDTVRRFE